ncbi:caspase family protein [Paludisphaera sp.]|uniref:caspase family protein n=1 Tax=Paludisphaera sp. TaxID=2017432 RepID=UPI00301C1A5D
MPKAIALTVGLNELHPDAYPGVSPLAGCEQDAMRVAELAARAGFEARGPLLSSKATRSDFIDEVLRVAGELRGDGDIFLLHYAGHGSHWPDDPAGDRTHDEDDGRDETICLYDGQMVDDELLRLWAHFRPGVRILVLADCCHSGSLIRGRSLRSPVDDAPSSSTRGRGPDRSDAAVRGTRAGQGVAGAMLRDRILDDREAERAYNALSGFYVTEIRDKLRRMRPLALDDLPCGVLTIAACEDYQTAKEEGTEGAFTRALIDVWDGGAFQGSYETFCNTIRARIQSRYGQSPRILTGGHRGVTIEFARQRPFQI